MNIIPKSIIMISITNHHVVRFSIMGHSCKYVSIKQNQEI